MITYIHKCDILRVEEATNEWGETSSNWKTIYSDVPCHFSQKSLRPSETTPLTSSRNDYKIFLHSSYNIIQSDKIIINDRTFVANEPMKYRLLSKQEIMITGISE
ncbi:MAG: hypothetical protein ACRC6E_03990 [Fusobacteriaceae bacterium]